MPPLVSELLADARSAKLPAAVSIGLLMAVLTIILGLSLSAVIFSGPLTPFVPRGVGLLLFGTFVLCLITAFTAPYKGIISMPLFAPGAALFAIGGTVSASMSDAPGEAMFVTMIAIMALSTLMAAAGFLVIGRLRLANLFLAIPYPVTAGFLAGLGWFVSVGSFSVMSGTAVSWETLPRLLDSDAVWKWVPGVLYAIGLFFATRRWSHYLILPASLVLATGLYHLALFSLGLSGEEVREAGLLLRHIPTGSLWPPVGADDLTLADWRVVASQVPAMLGVALITLMCIVLNASGLELSCGVEIDMNGEFRAEGIANLFAGLGGSAPGGNTSVFTVVAHATGAETRLTGIVTALPVGLILLFGGTALEIFPIPVLGAVLLFFGLGLMNDWLVAARKKLSHVDYGIVLFIALVTAIFGFLEGVAAGLIAAIVFFVVRASRVDAIAASFSGRDRLSKRSWSVTERAILRERGEQMRSYRLRGYIFFGSATSMGDRLKQALEADPVPQCLLLDFASVSGLDISAVNVFYRVIRTARLLGTKIVLSAVPDRLKSTLQRGLPEGEWGSLLFEEDLDRGLERCEQIVIAEWHRLHGGSEDARTMLFDLSIEDAVRQLERLAHFEDLTDRLRPWLESRSYAADETIVARGERQEGMQLLVGGRATMRREKDGARMGEYGPGSILAPQAIFGNHVAVVEMTAEEPSQTVLMSPSSHQSLEREDADLTRALAKFLMEGILDDQTRLTFAAVGGGIPSA